MFEELKFEAKKKYFFCTKYSQNDRTKRAADEYEYILLYVHRSEMAY